MAYKLSAALQGHSSDVRAVCSPSPSTVLSASRDATARIWTAQGSNGWSETAVLHGHAGFVNSAASSRLADGTQVAITGGNDSVINLWELNTASSNPIRTLIGHSGNVCCLDATADGLLASGSWDASAKIWDLNDPSGDSLYTLAGSDLSVWAVLILPGSTRQNVSTLTASADKLIRLYQNNKLVRTLKGHSQPVRALTLLTKHQDIFASASNDGSIRLWNHQTGEELKVLDGHDSFVYSLACTPEGHLVSSGEDRSVRIWDKLSAELKQVITIPAISIWSVAILSGTNDIIVGSSDSQVRIFTTEASRQAPADELKAYDELVAASTVSTAQIGDVKKTDLPSEEAPTTRQGKKEGDVMMVKNSITGSVDAYQWSSANNEWINVGQVVDAVGSGRKQLYEGKEYDYVFDVDVSEGMPPLKLPFNVTQNPYEAAETFLQKNDLPASYVEEVVRFIDKSTGGVELGGQGGTDPYTGNSSYRSSGASSQQPTTAAQTAYSGDPWSRASSTASSAAGASLLPHKTPLTFPQANIPAIQKKLLDFNNQLSEQPTTATEFPLGDGDIAILQRLLDSLQASASSLKLEESSLAVLEKLLEWPISYRFPALDLVRVVAMHQPVPIASSGILFTLLSHITPNANASVKENEINSMLAIRAVANCFSKAEGQKSLAENAGEALETLAVIGVPEVLSKNGKVALATVALNYSIIAVEGLLKGDTFAHLVDFVLSLLAGDDSEVLYRSLVALGNVAYAPESVRGSVSVGTLQALKSRAQTVAKKSQEDRIKKLVSELERKI